MQIDYTLDLGGGTHTRLSYVLMIVPPDQVVVTNPPEGKQPTGWARLINNLGVVPIYEPMAEVAEWFEENAPNHLDLGNFYRVDIKRVISVVAPDTFEVPEGEAMPTCVVQMDDGQYCPCYIPQAQFIEAWDKTTSGFFGG